MLAKTCRALIQSTELAGMAEVRVRVWVWVGTAYRSSVQMQCAVRVSRCLGQACIFILDDIVDIHEVKHRTCQIMRMDHSMLWRKAWTCAVCANTDMQCGTVVGATGGTDHKASYSYCLWQLLERGYGVYCCCHHMPKRPLLPIPASETGTWTWIQTWTLIIPSNAIVYALYPTTCHMCICYCKQSVYWRKCLLDKPSTCVCLPLS